jgi:predicted secreted hydrolase
MLYVVRGTVGDTGSVYGTYVLADGQAQDLAPGSVQVQATGSWTSPHTGATYPSGWQLTLPDGRKLVLQPQLADQELYFPSAQLATPAYWEGAVTITGDATGQGYVELTGYAGS